MYVHTFKNAEETCHALAAWIALLIGKRLSQKKFFTWVLAGGETPRRLYNILASPPYDTNIEWDRVHIFWGDERWVPFEDAASNAGMATKEFLQRVDIPLAQVHRMRTDMEAAISAKQYEKILHQYFDDTETSFDLVLCGMGEDGHTLSLFPGGVVDEAHWVSAVQTEKGERITLTPAIVNRSASVVFLVTGKKKAKVLQEIIEEPSSGKYPAQLIQPENGELHWFVNG